MCYRCGQWCVDDGDGVADGVAADVEVEVEAGVAALASVRPVTAAPTPAATTAVRISRLARVPVTDAIRRLPSGQALAGRLGPRLPKAWAAQPDDKPS
jgi:hypothetical protein